MSPRDEDTSMSGCVQDLSEECCGEESLEVLPLAAMSLYCDRLKEDGTAHVYLMGKLRTDGTTCEGALRLSDMVDRLEAHNNMTFDERIRAMRIKRRTADEWEISKVISSMNATLHQVLVNDMDAPDDDGHDDGGLNRRDYTNFIIEYIDVVRSVRDAVSGGDGNDGEGGMSNGVRTALMSRAFRAVGIPSSIVPGTEDVLETLNSILFDAISEDVDDDEMRSRDYTPFLMEYVEIVSDARGGGLTSSGEGGRSSSEAHRDVMLRAYKAGRMIGRSS